MTPLELLFLGYGEAAQAFSEAPLRRCGTYGRKTDADATRAAKIAGYDRTGAIGFETKAAAVATAGLTLSLPTADQALAAAREASPSIRPGTIYCDGNSVAPEAKSAAARAIEAAGGPYCDVAIMAPVYPARRHVPLLPSPLYATDREEALRDHGFTGTRILAGGIGEDDPLGDGEGTRGAHRRMLACRRPCRGDDEVTASLNLSWTGTAWAERGGYNLEQMMVHGIRRAEELEEVVKTLEGLGTGAAMSRSTAERLRAVGRLGVAASEGLQNKIAAIIGAARKGAA